MSDKYLLEGHQSVDRFQISDFRFQIKRGKILTQEELAKISTYKRYQVTSDGISPRVIPGMRNSLHQANSYEHLEDGHTTEDSLERSRQVAKRNQKAATFLKEDYHGPVLFGSPKAPLTIVSWGSMKGPILQALKNNEERFNYLHFNYLYPLAKEKVKKALQSCQKLLLVENNSTGQLGQLLQMTTGIEITDRLLKYSGRPIYPEEILEKVAQV